ncbi:MAG: A/G-specific adenine glycosylase [Gammaproteobacteria bacterium]|nr:A/G-specific adenine glycosylase [Gammaproteobacteria bacterium]MCY4218884.1 A/G-specific adenine glycosylase [Gammaproteobacteria bacterium]MCY4274960.1 A/G-specific adenine glycosylase [Gammaproteobacteria bacterium]
MNFTTEVLNWHDQCGRRNLPWHAQKNPYRIWVSEIMLQQTRVETVIPFYQDFMRRFPDISTLAIANLDEVMSYWSGLGYYSRARNLHQAARRIRNEYNGIFPQTLDEVVNLPGIGRSTAGAILAFSRNERHPILDGNVKRVLSRYHAVGGPQEKQVTKKRLWELADRHTPEERVADYTQAIMDLGALICRARNPLCGECPVSSRCLAYTQDQIESYPARKQKKLRPIKSCRMLVLRRSDGFILLCKRPLKGIWGGLWSLPQLDHSDLDVNQYCKEMFNFEVISTNPLALLRHGFSHYELEIMPILCEITVSKTVSTHPDQDYLWYDPLESVATGLPTAVKRIIEMMKKFDASLSA